MNEKNNKNVNINYNDKSTASEIDELLLENRETLNQLIIENSQRKEKSFITVKELEIIRHFEKNLLKLIEKCPPKVLKDLINDDDKLN